MQLSTLHFDGQTFILTAGQDVAALKASIVAALQPGSGFVEFESVGRGLVSIFITPSVAVRFETTERTGDGMSEWEAHPAAMEEHGSFDFDYFAEEFAV